MSVHLTCSCFQKPSEIEVASSYWLRGALGVVGVGTVVAAALIHFKVILPHLSGVVSWAGIGGGSAATLLGLSVKGVKSKDQVGVQKRAEDSGVKQEKKVGSNPK